MAMIQVDEAREIILSKIEPKGIEKVSLDALGFYFDGHPSRKGLVDHRLRYAFP